MKGLKFALVALLLFLVACRNTTDDPTSEPALQQPTTATTVGDTAESDSAPAESAEAEDTSTSSDSPAPQTPAEPEDISFETADGLTVFGTFYPSSSQGPSPGVLLLHMNGGRRQDWDAVARQIADSGYAVTAVDMRGHGETGSNRDWEKVADDLQLVVADLGDRDDVDALRVAIVGASIGANMALISGAAQPDIDTVVLLSPGLDYFGVTTDDAVVDYGERPLLIVASQEDAQAADSSQVLHDLALGEAQLEMYEGAGHGTAMFGPRPELVDLITGWLDKHLKGEVQARPVEGLPRPTLFDRDWTDRDVYRAGLIGAEQSVVEQLPGASTYLMDVTISPDLQSVTGDLEVLYTNQEDVALNEVYFHLFPNLLGGKVAISELTVNGEPVEPDYASEQTVLRVPLAAALNPGEQMVIKMSFEVEVPTEGGSNYGVFASVDDVLALAHFYPQIAVFDHDGWNIEIPSENADVSYGDSSFYLVRVTAPAEQVVVASGVEIDGQQDGDNQVLTFASGPTRDFYIASSDRYTVASHDLGGTTINNYGFPEYAEHNELALETAVEAMESFNERFGAYPFTEFDIAPTPNLALGVEYPGVVVINSRIYDPEVSSGETPSRILLESTVAHEVGHQWFYSVVGNDQPDEPWLDEALTQYITYLYYVDRYGARNAEGFRQSFIGRWQRVDGAEIPIGLPAGDYEGPEYGAIVYGRGPLFFEALGEEMGEETFAEFLRDYYQENKYGLVTGAELKALAEEHCGCDLTPLFAEWVGET